MDMKTDRYLYVTPEGFANLILSVAGGVLTEVSFVKDEAREGLPKAIACHDVPEYARAVNEARESGQGEDAISLAVKWLDIYFAGGRLTGYAGGIANKKALLRLENAGSFEAGLLQL